MKYSFNNCFWIETKLHQFFPQISLTTRHPVIHLPEISSEESGKRRVKRSTTDLLAPWTIYSFCRGVTSSSRFGQVSQPGTYTDVYAYRQRKRIDFPPSFLPLVGGFLNSSRGGSCAKPPAGRPATIPTCSIFTRTSVNLRDLRPQR